jgi:hypothetical protein
LNFPVKVSTLILLFSSLFLSSAGQAADPVGTLKFVHGLVNIESDSGVKRKAVKGDDLIQDELVVTGPAGIAVIQLSDDSRMTLRPNSEFRVRHLKMDDDNNGSSSQPSAVLDLLRGGLRLFTGLIGKLNPGGYRLNTPVATIGIRGTEFNTRLCNTDCAAEERILAGNDAAAGIKEGLYVNVDDGGVFLRNFASDDSLDLSQGESGYVADLSSQPIKLSLVPAFQREDSLPSPGELDFDNIDIPDDVLPAAGPGVDAAVLAAAAAAAAATTAATATATTATAAASSAKKSAEIDISGTYELEVEYGKDMAHADRKWFFGSKPDIEFILTQKGDKVKGEFEGHREGTIKGRIDDETVTVEFVLEALGGEYKDGAGTWIVQDDGNLEGDFTIRDQQRGVVRGRWILTRTD